MNKYMRLYDLESKEKEEDLTPRFCNTPVGKLEHVHILVLRNNRKPKKSIV